MKITFETWVVRLKCFAHNKVFPLVHMYAYVYAMLSSHTNSSVVSDGSWSSSYMAMTSSMEGCNACATGGDSPDCETCRNSYYWTDGANVTWTAWIPDFPESGHLCTRWDAEGNMGWRDTDCTEVAANTICKTGAHHWQSNRYFPSHLSKNK